MMTPEQEENRTLPFACFHGHFILSLEVITVLNVVSMVWKWGTPTDPDFHLLCFFYWAKIVGE